MSLRKQARILGISHTYLSMLVNGKRKWPEELKARYEELVTTSVTTPTANTSLAKASEDDFVPENGGAQERTRTFTLLSRSGF